MFEGNYESVMPTEDHNISKYFINPCLTNEGTVVPGLGAGNTN